MSHSSLAATTCEYGKSSGRLRRVWEKQFQEAENLDKEKVKFCLENAKLKAKTLKIDHSTTYAEQVKHCFKRSMNK
jgi:hypothetical protein